MSSMKKGLKTLYGSKVGKILPVLIIAGLVASASASVFVVYYGAATGSAQSNDVILAVGSDSSACTTVYPCGTTTLSSTNDVATVTLSFGKSAAGTPQPQTYYTDLLEVKNPSANAHSITSVQVGTILNNAVLGSVSVYYCPTTDPTSLAAIATDCPHSLTFTTTTGGTLSGTFPEALAATTGIGYFVISGFASSTATVGNTVTFQIQVQWK
ncbi:MAG: hypothetical protein KGI38_10905 [Thaumarchaeota archaeon]|nr:hypothetical protein [Nitrososphaerota archaeon]